MEIDYIIGEKKFKINLDDSFDFWVQDGFISDKFGDITKNSNWYKSGFKIINFNDVVCFQNLKNLKDIIINFVKKEFPNKSLKGFKLEKYHDYVSEDEHIIIDKSLKRQYF